MDATSKQYKYIFAVVDGFSKFIWLYPTKTTNADEAITKLECWCSIFGNPERIISDRGSAFTSKTFEEFCSDNNIEHILSTTGVPRGNGQIERVNRVIISVLSKLSAEKPETWYREVNKVQRAINSTIHRSINRSPFEVMFGVKMRNNSDTNIIHILKNELMDEFDNSRQQMRYESKLQIEKIQEEYKKNFDRKRKKNVDYKVGDLVAIKRTQFVAGKKLANEYLGPYEITKVKRNGRYEVRKAAQFDGPNATNTSNDHLKLWSYCQANEDSYSSSGTYEESDGRM